MDENEQNLWASYHATRGVSDRSSLLARNALVELYMPLARDAASFEAEKLGHHVSIEILESDAFLALIEAVEKYRFDAGASFETFARRTIHFRILDELRVRDDVGRTARQRAKKYNEARNAFYHLHGRRPTNDTELQSELKISKRDLFNWRKAGHTHVPSRISIDVAGTTDNGQRTNSEMMKDLKAKAADPDDAMDVDILLSHCDADERLYIQLHFYLGWGPWTIAKRLRASVFKVGQALNGAMEKLRCEVWREGATR